MAETALPILELKNAGKIYAQGGRAIEALRGANLRVKKGEFICLIGASGCGKSTLLRMLAGYLEPCSGSIRTALNGGPAEAEFQRRHLGYVFQQLNLMPLATVSGVQPWISFA